MRRFRLQVGRPADALRPNARVHKHEKARATKFARQAAFYDTIQALGTSAPPMWERARLTVRWPYRDDLDNALASLKATLDGICDAGIVVNDRGIVSITIERCRCRWITLEFTEASLPNPPPQAQSP